MTKRGSLSRRFASDTAGVAATEFVLIAPLLFLILIGSFTIFDWLRSSYVTERATFTVSDVISRQVVENDDFFKQVSDTFAQLVPNDVGEPELRIMSIIHTEDGLEVDWTWSSGTGSWTDEPAPLDDLPEIAMYDSVIVAQSLVRIRPTFSYLFDLIRPEEEKPYVYALSYTATTRPRFVSRIAQAE